VRSVGVAFAVLAVTAALPLAAQPTRARVRPPATPPPVDRVLVPAGPFTMGSNAEGEPDERPEHTRTLHAYRIDRHEVTREDYFRCVRAGRCSDAWARAGWTDPRGPVTSVSWSMAQAYCRWAGGRLPTEPEWEKAARGTDGRRFPWGNDPPTPAHAVYGLRMNVGQPAPVGTHALGASPYGALDMAGNVWEWTATVYDPYAYREPAIEPTCARALATYADLRRLNLWAFTGAMGIPNNCHYVLRGGADRTLPRERLSLRRRQRGRGHGRRRLAAAVVVRRSALCALTGVRGGSP
jgi:formylglycine-generating enzyme required for sulfatase activity